MPKTKFSDVARRVRFCDMCEKKLQKDEVMLCKSCFQMMSGGYNHD